VDAAALAKEVWDRVFVPNTVPVVVVPLPKENLTGVLGF